MGKATTRQRFHEYIADLKGFRGFFRVEAFLHVSHFQANCFSNACEVIGKICRVESSKSPDFF